MRKSTLALLFVTTIFAVTALSAVVYARDSDNASGSMMASGMMGHGMMGRGGMMGGNGMMGGGMKGGKSAMMGHCGEMMQGDNRGGSGRPNDQWRNGGPSEDDQL